MNIYETNNFLQPKRHVLAIACGIVGGTLPNNNSNTHPFVIGAIIAAFVVKMVYGDYDKDFRWTFSDLIFWIFTITEGILGAFIITNIQ